MFGWNLGSLWIGVSEVLRMMIWVSRGLVTFFPNFRFSSWLGILCEGVCERG